MHLFNRPTILLYMLSSKPSGSDPKWSLLDVSIVKLENERLVWISSQTSFDDMHTRFSYDILL